MARLFEDFISGTLSGSLIAGATTINGGFLYDVPTVTGGDTFTLVIDPEAEDNGPEIVTITNHTYGTTWATITRGQEGTSDEPHASGRKVIGPLTAEDLETWADHVGGTTVTDHPEATSSVRGFMSAADKTLLDDIEDGSEILVVHGTYYQSAGQSFDPAGTYYCAKVTVTVPAAWNSCHISVQGVMRLTCNAPIVITGYATDATAAKNQIGSAVPTNSGALYYDSLSFHGSLSNPGTSVEIGVKAVVTGTPSGSDYLNPYAQMNYVLTRTS